MTFQTTVAQFWPLGSRVPSAQTRNSQNIQIHSVDVKEPSYGVHKDTIPVLYTLKQ